MEEKIKLKGLVFDVLRQAARETGMRAYIVGGYVRDYYLGVPSNDIDVVVEGSGIEFAKYIAENIVDTKLNYYENYGTAMVRIDGLEVEFVGARKEMYKRSSRKPIVENGTLRDDQLRRDFTMNAMAVSLNEDDFGSVIDPFHGKKDLEDGAVRSIQDPNITFSDDPLRILRGIRLYVKLLDCGKNGNIDAKTQRGMALNGYRLKIVSQERITCELDKMFKYKNSGKGITLMYILHLTDKLVQGSECDVFNAPFISGYNRICSALGEFEKETGNNYSQLKWYFLFRLQLNERTHEENLKLARLFKLPTALANFCTKMDFLLDLFNNTDDFRDMYRYIPYVLGKEWRDFFVMLYSYQIGADFVNKKTIFKDEWVRMIENEEKEFVNWKCPLTGDEIGKELNIPEGRELGEVKKALEQAILGNEIGNTKKESLEYIKGFRMA